MVAAAGVRGRIDHRLGAALLVTILVGALLIGWTSDQSALFRQIDLGKPPEVLADRAGEVLISLGYSPLPADRAYGFGSDANTLEYLEKDKDPLRWERLRKGELPAMYFWYRQGRTHLRSTDPFSKIRISDPPFYTPETVTVVLDVHGRLIELYAGSGTGQGFDRVPETTDWLALFQAADLDISEFMVAPRIWEPAVTHDAYGSWERRDTDADHPMSHVEAAMHGGKLVFFRMQTPWSGSFLEQPSKRTRGTGVLYQLMYLLIIVACLVEARRNLRRGRGDRAGARRLAFYVLSITMLQWLLRSNHSTELAVESQQAIQACSYALYRAILLCWVPYMALEPHIRRRWPEKIVSWTRLLAGRFRDPLVGRDVLIGLAGATLTQLLFRLYYLIPDWLGQPASRPIEIWPDTLLGPGSYISEFFRFQGLAVFFGFALLFLLLTLTQLVRKEWLGTALIVAIVTAVWYGELPGLYPELSLALTGLRILGFVFILRRFGLLAAIVAIFADGFLNTFPLTLALSQWYGENSIFALLVLIGLASYALAVSVRKRRTSSLTT
jgi:serine/threonine-protein kinase